MTPADLIHVFGMWAAAVFGMFVVFGRKGTWMHKWNGRGYVAAMLVVCLAALGKLDGPHDFSVVQALALLALMALSAGALAIRGHPRSVARLSLHGHAMAASIACLAALGAVEGAAALGVPVMAAAAAALILGAVAIGFAPVQHAARRLSDEV